MSSLPGLVVYLQPELFTSATGPDLHHRHTHTRAGPRPRLHPRVPRCRQGFAGEGGGEGNGSGCARALVRAESWPHPAPHPAAILPHHQQQLSPMQDPSPGAADLLSLLASILEIGRNPQPQETSLPAKVTPWGTWTSPQALQDAAGLNPHHLPRRGWRDGQRSRQIPVGRAGWMDGQRAEQTDGPSPTRPPAACKTP